MLLAFSGFSPSVHAGFLDALQGAVKEASTRLDQMQRAAEERARERERVSNGYRLSETETDDSRLTLEGIASRPIRGILLAIAKQDIASDTFSSKPLERRIPVESTTFNVDFFLTEGPGRYRAEIYECEEELGRSCLRRAAFEVLNRDTRDLSFLLPTEKVQSAHPEIVELASRLTAGHSTERERSRAIHDWIAANVAYDAPAYFDGSYPKLPADALSAFRKLVAVCYGYSNLNAALHRAAGIRAKVVMGKAQPVYTGEQALASTSCETHAWNEVFIDGAWRLQDVTWDAGTVDPVSKTFERGPHSRYFDADPNDFARTHEKCVELPD